MTCFSKRSLTTPTSAWVLLYIERWLKAPMQMPDGTLVARGEGDPTGFPDLAVAG